MVSAARPASAVSSVNRFSKKIRRITSRALALTVSPKAPGIGKTPAARLLAFTKPIMGSSTSLPREAKVIIVGGGVIGTSVAYHLTKLGWKDVILLEQGQLGGGTSWHAAGLVGRLRTSNSMTRINKYSAELYAALEKETGHSIGWKQVGSIIVGRSADRMIQLQRTAAMCERFGEEGQW